MQHLIWESKLRGLGGRSRKNSEKDVHRKRRVQRFGGRHMVSILENNADDLHKWPPWWGRNQGKLLKGALQQPLFLSPPRAPHSQQRRHTADYSPTFASAAQISLAASSSLAKHHQASNSKDQPHIHGYVLGRQYPSKTPSYGSWKTIRK